MSETSPSPAEQTWEPFHPEATPSLEDLRSKVFAVHATEVLPSGDRMVAGLRAASPVDVEGLDEWPSFRPTIHFSLGELMQPHRLKDVETAPYALLAPLGRLESHLINVGAHDTFTLGDVPLTKDMTLLVPPGTDTSGITAPCTIREYDGPLRAAVDETIADNGGWPLRMSDMSGLLGDVATHDGMNVNVPDFFEPLLAERPHVSFGSAIESERGEGFRFGMVDHATIDLTRQYLSHHTMNLPTPALKFLRNFVHHHARQLDRYVANADVPPQSRATFAAKRAEVDSWLNVAAVDARVREAWGKTLSCPQEATRQAVVALRHQPDKLWEWAADNIGSLDDCPPNQDEVKDSYSGHVGQRLSTMSFAELQAFAANDPDMWNHVDVPTFSLHYASTRWATIGTAAARAEGIDHILRYNTVTMGSSPEHAKEYIIESVIHCLNENSSRLSTALDILNEPAVREYLARRGLDNPGYSFTSLEDVRQAHPETRAALGRTDFAPATPDEAIANILLPAAGHSFNSMQAELARAQHNMRLLLPPARTANWLAAQYCDNIAVAQTPLRDRKPVAELLIGDLLNVYQIIERNHPNVSEFWDRLGLGDAYRQQFPSDTLFWQSDQSLVDIYRQLSKATQPVPRHP